MEQNQQDVLLRLKDELRFVFITSEAQVLPFEKRSSDAVVNKALGIAIDVKPSPYEKCARCWHRREDVGNDDSHPELCLRCVDNIQGEDEVRHFA